MIKAVMGHAMNSLLEPPQMAAGIGGQPRSVTAPGALDSRARFLSACRCEPLAYPPAWLMRQAGRALPEYRALKQHHSFLELVRTPELATEVTLQPIRRFDFDAAILFSDILVVPEGLGQGYRFRETGGVEMDFPIRDRSDIELLELDRLRERLDYIPQTLELLRERLGGKKALIGFAGSPWTLANFMIEGGSAPAPARTLAMMHFEPELFAMLMEKLTLAVIELLRMQIEAGADAVQIFDSHGGLLPRGLFESGSSRWIRDIISALDTEVPVIVFSKGARAWDELIATGADVIAVDQGLNLRKAAEALPDRIAVQGNLDPSLMVGEPELVRDEVRRLRREMRGRPGWILNLGHGLPPGANLESIGALVEAAREGRGEA